MKLYIIVDIVAFIFGFMCLCCLICGAIYHGAGLLWLSIMTGGIAMQLELKDR